MIQDRPEWEINLKSMIFSALYRWKLILAVAIALALLLGGGTFLSAFRANSDTAQQDQHRTEDTMYNAEKISLEKSIDSLSKGIEAQEAYLEDSILMQLDYHSVHQAKTELYLSTPYQIMPGMSYQNTDKAEHIAALYVSTLSDSALLSNIAAQIQTETKYLEEVIDIKAENSIITVTVNWTNSEEASKVMDALLAYAESSHDHITQAVGEHTLAVVLKTVDVVMDRSVQDQQKQELTRLNDDKLALTEKVTALNSLSAPSAPKTSAKDIASTAVKWAVLGGFLGAALVAFCCCFGYIFSDKVHSGSDVSTRCGVRILGEMSCGKKADPITRYLRRAEGRVISEADEIPALLQETLRQYANGASNILVTGDIKPQLVETYTAHLQQGLSDIQLTAGGSLLKDAAAMRSFKQCDAVILLEKSGVSRYNTICSEAVRINDLNKPLIGCIIVE